MELIAVRKLRSYRIEGSDHSADVDEYLLDNGETLKLYQNVK